MPTIKMQCFLNPSVEFLVFRQGKIETPREISPKVHVKKLFTDTSDFLREKHCKIGQLLQLGGVI